MKIVRFRRVYATTRDCSFYMFTLINAFICSHPILMLSTAFFTRDFFSLKISLFFFFVCVCYSTVIVTKYFREAAKKNSLSWKILLKYKIHTQKSGKTKNIFYVISQSNKLFNCLLLFASFVLFFILQSKKNFMATLKSIYFSIER